MTAEPEVWLREADSGWVEVEGQDLIIRNSFVSGTNAALVVRYYRNEERSVRARAIFGPGTQGPPGCAHGGSIAALLDEVMGCAVWCSGRMGVSGDLHVHFRRMLPIPQRCIAEARIERTEGRKIWASGRLRDISGDTVFAEAEGIFLEAAPFAK